MVAPTHAETHRGDELRSVLEQLPARFIELIGRLYKVEAEARRDALGVQALQAQRQLHSAPVLKLIEDLALQHLHGVLPGSLLGKALHYVTAQWPKLVS